MQHGRRIATVLTAVACLAHAATATARPAYVPAPGSPVAAGQGATAAQFSPDGRMLAVADYNLNAVSVYQVGSGGRLHRAPGSPFPVGPGPVSLSFSPSGHALAVADLGQNELTVDSVSRAGKLTPQHGSPFALLGGPYSIAYSPGGRLLAAAESGSDAVQLLTTTRSGTPTAATTTISTGAGSGPAAVAFSPDAKQLAVADHTSNQISVFDLAAPTVAAAASAPKPAPRPGPAALPTATPAPGSPFATGASPDTVAYNTSGSLLAASNYGADAVSVYAVDSAGTLTAAAGSPVSTGSGSGPDSAVFSRANSLLAVALGNANTTALYSVGTGGSLAPVPGTPLPAGTGPAAVAFNGQATVLATANIYSNSVSVYAATAPPPAAVRIRSLRATVRRGRIPIRLSCAARLDGASAHPCRGRITVSTGKHRLSHSSYRLRSGHSATLTVALDAYAKRLLRRHRSIRTVASATVTGGHTARDRLQIRR